MSEPGTSSARALVFANGDVPSLALVREMADAAGLIVAADGGVNKALAAGVTVQAVVGDLDSVGDEARAKLPPEIFHKDTDVNRTDLQKAIGFCIARGYRGIDVICGGGGRADHALANLSVIPLFRGEADVRLVDDLFEVRLVEGTVAIEAPVGTVVSLVAIGQCRGVTTTGMRWDLADFPLAFSPYGVHNEVARSPATVSVMSGDLLLFRGRWVERHG